MHQLHFVIYACNLSAFIAVPCILLLFTTVLFSKGKLKSSSVFGSPCNLVFSWPLFSFGGKKTF
uniref:Uncharacterized protein n=1 Tax=Arundo donax TaxID=35708 RepID=A0A0A8XPL5_ARUDO